MLGEKRSKPAFYADSSVSVQEEHPVSEHERPGMEIAEDDGSGHLQPESAASFDEILAETEETSRERPDYEEAFETEPVPARTSGKTRALRTHNLL